MTRIFTLRLFSLLLLLQFSNFFSDSILAQCFCYDVKVCIDGQDKLHIKGAKMWWEHIDFSPPGQHPGCSSYNVGILVNGNPWTTWDSSFAISNTSCATLKDSTILCYNICTLLQSPSAGNGWETIYDFNDDAPGGPHLYEHLFTFCYADTSSLSSTFTATTPVCNGSPSSITYTGTGTNSDAYNWNFDGGTVISGTGKGPYVISWPGPGNYPVTLSVSGCGNSGTTTIPVKVNTIPSSAFTDSFPTPCAGQVSFIRYTGNNPGTGIFNWNFGNGTVISGNGAGPYEIRWDSAGTNSITLSVTDSGCVSDTSSKNITVSSLPIVSIIPVSPSICWGDSVYISASGAIYYTWSNMNGNTISTDSSVTVNPDSTTLYTVTGSNGTCMDTGHLTVQVMGPYQSGTITSPKDTICNGQTIQLTVVGSTGDVFWQSAVNTNSFDTIGSLKDTAYNVHPSQTSYYRVISGNGICADTSDSFKVVVNSLAPPIVVSPDTIMCRSDSIQLHTINTYNSYQWNTGDTWPYTYAYYAGGYWVTVTDADNCTAVSDHRYINVYQEPSVSVIINGNILASFNSEIYQWYYNDTLIPGATGAVYIAKQSGYYAVEITDSNGCQELSNNINVIVNGIFEPDPNDLLTIFPDPFSSMLYIKNSNSAAMPDQLTIYDLAGRMILNKRIDNPYGSPAFLELPELSNGAYYIELKRNNELKFSKQLIKISGYK